MIYVITDYDLINNISIEIGYPIEIVEGYIEGHKIRINRPAECINKAGRKCQVSFTYNGKLYDNECATAGWEPWCYDVRGNGKWDYCTGDNGYCGGM